jgi:hypothetical protein
LTIALLSMERIFWRYPGVYGVPRYALSSYGGPRSWFFVWSCFRRCPSTTFSK